MVTPQAIMFEPTMKPSVAPQPTTTSGCNNSQTTIPLPDVLPSSEPRDGHVVTGSPEVPMDSVENNEVLELSAIDEAELQKYRMIVPLDIVTSIMISHRPLMTSSGDDTSRPKYVYTSTVLLP